MAMYKVRWEIEVDARSHREAARKALEIQRDPESIATVFEVRSYKAPRASAIKKCHSYEYKEIDLLNT
jgi:hypothetical protein